MRKAKQTESSYVSVPEIQQREEAVIYARVSKDQEREGFSIPAQRELLGTYGAVKAFTVLREFIEVETAKQAGRTAFDEMIAFIKKNRNCRTLLVEKTDRLYRNLKDYVTIDGLGLTIHFVKENVVLSPESRSNEKFMHGIKVLMAKNYIDNLSEETRKGMLQKAREGIWPSYAPLGFRNIPGPDGKRIIGPDPNLAPAIRISYEQCATGKYSIKQIASIAKANGLAYRKSGTPVPTSTMHKILRNRIYSGDFDFDGTTYKGNYEPIISRELWEKVQSVLSGRGAKKTRNVRDGLAFSGLITCGHCGCAMVGEIKKGRYVYYHCTGYKGKCPEPYTREEVLGKKFTDLLRGISFSEEVLAWVAQALRESHGEERKCHVEAIGKLQTEYRRIQDRIDAMYMDKLDGRIDNDFFDRKASEFRTEQCHVMRDIEAHQNANQSYIEEGIRLLDLARRAPVLFENQLPEQKRKLLDFVLSNCRWKAGQLEAEYRKPFDMLAVAVAAQNSASEGTMHGVAQDENWLPVVDSNHDLPAVDTQGRIPLAPAGRPTRPGRVNHHSLLSSVRRLAAETHSSVVWPNPAQTRSIASVTSSRP